MTARHNPGPAPSKRAERRVREERRAQFAAFTVAASANRDLWAALTETAAVLTSPAMRHLLALLAWEQPAPLRPGMVTWPTRARRRRR